MSQAGLTIAAVLEHHGADLHRVRETGWQPLRCPYHNDRTASASVNLAKGAFCCHACGVKGSAISLLMDREGLDYEGALQFAEEALGQSVERVPQSARRGASKRQPSRWRERLFQ